MLEVATTEIVEYHLYGWMDARVDFSMFLKASMSDIII